MSAFDRVVGDAIDAFFAGNPVTATFAGETAWDGVLPAAGRNAPLERDAVCNEVAGRLDDVGVPDTPAARLDARMIRAKFAWNAEPYNQRARYHNPAWYTGEIAFGIISLLLPSPAERDELALQLRLEAVLPYLRDGLEQLRDREIPRPWLDRARREARAIERLVRDGLPLHPLRAHVSQFAIDGAVAALHEFIAALDGAPDGDPASGEAHLAFVMREVHGLAETPAQLERRAQAAFDEALAHLDEQARTRDPARSWREQIAELATLGPAPDDVIPSYRRWHERAMHDAQTLVTPAAEYDLEFALLPEWARAVADDLYFLFYRSPAARAPGAGSMYWVTPPSGSDDDVRRAHNTAAVKLIHAVHHGSIGHHTQNVRARSAASRVARFSGTDGAAGIALLGAGTLVEGWACYAEDLLAEIPEFYSDGERLMLDYFTLRNIACCLADIRLHCGRWTLEEMRHFYRDDVAFAPARIESETTRNSMFPGSRLMYWTGTTAIAALRRTTSLPAKTFHDRLLAYGGVPVAWIAEEEARCSTPAASLH